MPFEIEESPFAQEVIKLGLGDSPFLVPEKQVQARFGIDQTGQSRIVIYVQDISVEDINHDTGMIRYNVVGHRQFTQPWDPGGSYLDPTLISPDGMSVNNG